MRVHSLAATFVVVLVALAPLASADLGERDGFAVYITYPQERYDVGSQVNVTVHVFYRGEYHDADSVSLMIDWPGDRTIPLLNWSTGRYNGTFIIEVDDVRDYNGEVTLEAEAEMTDARGLLSARDYVDLFIDGAQLYPALYYVDPDDYHPSPGDELEYVIVLNNEYGPVDADTGFPEVDLREEDTYERTRLETTRLAVGTYAFSFTVKDNITESMVYRVEVLLERTIGSITQDAGGYFKVEVDLLDVWARIVNTTYESTELELIAVDGRGRVIPEAVFDLEWDYRNKTGSWVYEEGTWTADLSGRMRATLDTPELNYTYVDVDGVVTGAGYVQEFGRGFPGTPSTYAPDPFRVTNDVEGPIAPGQQHTITHNVTYAGEPVTGEEVFVYYTDEHNIYYHGNQTTDSNGQFEVTIDVPADLRPDEPRWPDWIGAHVQWGENGTGTGFPFYEPPNRWLDIEEEWSDEDLTVEVSELHPGHVVTVSLDHHDADGEFEDGCVLWKIVTDENWSNWVRSLSGHSGAGYEWNGEGYEATFMLPSFITEDMEIEVVGLIRFFDRTEDIVVANTVSGLFPTVIPPEPPGAPTDLSAEQDIDTVHLSWKAPVDDGGSTISSYVVYRGTSSETMEELNTTGHSRTYRDSTIVMGQGYYYAVAAVNKAGEGAMSEPLMIETIEYRPPSAPSNLSDSFDRRRVYLEWDPPEDDGGQPVARYIVLRGDGPDDLEEIANTTHLQYIDTSVDVGSYYYYAVKATNPIGTGEPCEARRVRADHIVPPPPPEEVSATYIDQTVVINWSVPSDDGGDPITGYIVMRGSGPLDLEPLAEVGLETTYNDTDIEPDVMYYYTVSAVNGMGTGDPSSKFTVHVPAIDPPSTPTGVTLEFIEDRIKVSWLPSEDDGGSPVTGYRVLRGFADGGLEELAVVTIGTTYFDLQVERGQTYRYRIVAINVEKESEPSPEVTLKVPEVASEEEWTLGWYMWAAMVAAAVTVLAVVFIVLRRQDPGQA